MPQIANITVKKNDGTTDVVYTGLVPSAGDKSPAIWRANSLGTAPALRPEFMVTSQPNGPKTARRVNTKFSFPSLVTGSDGRKSVADRVVMELSVVLPQGMDEGDVNEAVSQGVNLLNSTLVRDSLKIGYAPI